MGFGSTSSPGPCVLTGKETQGVYQGDDLKVFYLAPEKHNAAGLAEAVAAGVIPAGSAPTNSGAAAKKK